jgi:nicotinamide riboside kinase
MKNYRRIVVIGPESTGKTSLTKNLAAYFEVNWLPEYAREYIEKLDRPYVYGDVEIIATKQVALEKEALASTNSFTIIDTDLIITKIWFQVVYQKMPDWIDSAIRAQNDSFYLLCATDIPWEDDPVRENGGEMREKLFEIYENELNFYGFTYGIVRGLGEERLKNALKIMQEEIS